MNTALHNHPEMIDMYDFYTRMENHHIMISFKGEITADLLSAILHITETRLDKSNEEPRIKKKVFNILVECLQNLYHHIDEMDPHVLAPEEQSDDLELRSAILMIGKDNSSYYILTGNHIENDKIEPLRAKLDKVNAMNKEELKLYYQDVLNNVGFSKKGGGGLGMIDIARKSGQKLGYNFQPVNNKISFFSLSVKVGGDQPAK